MHWSLEPVDVKTYLLH